MPTLPAVIVTLLLPFERLFDPSITTTVHGGRPEVLRPRAARRFW